MMSAVYKPGPGTPELPSTAIDMAAVERRMFEKLYASSSDKEATGSVSGSVKLLSSMSARLTTLEAAQRSLRAELIEKDREILRLKARLSAPTQASSIDGLELDALRAENAAMKSFLLDYGLEWVGSDGKNCAAPSYYGPELDLPVFLLRLRQLNTVAGEGKSHVLREGNAAKLVAVSSIPLVVYKDGIVLRDGPFRPFSSESCAAFVDDVLDGFFPDELKADFPEGTVFALNDKTDVTFAEDRAPVAAQKSGCADAPVAFQAFSGAGSSIAGTAAATSAPSAPLGGVSSGRQSDAEAPLPPTMSRALSAITSVGAPEVAVLSADDLLGALPGVRIRDGRVIDVRASMAQLLQPPPAAPIVIHSQALATARHAPAPPPAATSIQVSSPAPPPLTCCQWLQPPREPLGAILEMLAVCADKDAWCRQGPRHQAWQHRDGGHAAGAHRPAARAAPCDPAALRALLCLPSACALCQRTDYGGGRART
jgi:hypothetical protein